MGACDCEVIEHGERKWLSAMEWHETLYIDDLGFLPLGTGVVVWRAKPTTLAAPLADDDLVRPHERRARPRGRHAPRLKPVTSVADDVDCIDCGAW